MHSLLVIHNGTTENDTETLSSRSPDVILRSCGYVVEVADTPEQALA